MEAANAMKFLIVLVFSLISLGAVQSKILMCRPGRFRCEDHGACIPQNFVCDGRIDCGDGSDETDCAGGSLCKIKQCSDSCYVNNNRAICTCPHGYELDESDNKCRDIDECANNNALCSQNCTNTLGSYKCSCFSGFKSNADGSCYSDETGVVRRAKLVCTTGKHPCDNGESCISGEFVCDGSLDCADGSDEENCEDGRYCKLKQCEHKTCRVTRNSGNVWSTVNKYTSCICNNGFNLNEDGISCDDIDECKQGTHNCTQICTNLKGSFSCSCAQGHYFNPRTGICRAIGKHALLYVTRLRTIFAKDVRNDRIYSIMTYESGYKAFEKVLYDPLKERLLWLESSPEGVTVSSSNFKGQNKNTVPLDYKIVNAGGFAFDWLTNKVYISDAANGLIVACEADDGSCSVVVETGSSSEPIRMVLDPVKRTMFWIDNGTIPRILTSSMDGLNVTELKNITVFSPSAIYLDPFTNTIFLADTRKTGRPEPMEIENVIVKYSLSSFVTSKINIGNTIGKMMFRDIAVFEDSLYFATSRYVYSLPLTKSVVAPQLMVPDFPDDIVSLSIYHPSLTPVDKYNNPCKNSKCDEMCLLSTKNETSCAVFVKSDSEDPQDNLDSSLTDEVGMSNSTGTVII